MRKIILGIILLTVINYALEARAPIKKYKSANYKYPTYKRNYTNNNNNYCKNKIKKVEKERDEYKKKWDYEARRAHKLERELKRYKNNYKYTKDVQKKYNKQEKKERKKKWIETYNAKQILKKQMNN